MTHARRTVVAATLCTVLGALPAFLLGASAVLVRADLGFSETQLGLAVAAFFGASALASTPAGRLVERIGAAAAMRLVALGSAGVLLGIAALARSYAQLLAFMALAGLSMAVAHPAANLALAGAIARRRQGLAFGIKQSGMPMASLAGGLMLPLVGLTFGWRWTYALLALGAVAFVLVAPRAAGGRRAAGGQGGTRARGGIGLAVLATAAACGIGATNAMGAFYVESAVSHGVAAGAAGAWFAFGSLSSIGARVWLGWRADRRAGGHLPRVAVLLGVGALAVASLSQAGRPALFGLATALAFGAGWGWMGLFQLSVVRLHRHAPAAATGVIETGASAGAVIGPPAFGALAEHVSYAAAWLAAGAAVGTAAILVLAGRAVLLRREAGTAGR